MPIYQEADISVESWVEMTDRVPVRHEIDRDHDCATLFFGARNDYVLYLGRESLRTVIDHAGQALAELDARCQGTPA